MCDLQSRAGGKSPVYTVTSTLKPQLPPGGRRRRPPPSHRVNPLEPFASSTEYDIALYMASSQPINTSPLETSSPIARIEPNAFENDTTFAPSVHPSGSRAGCCAGCGVSP